VHPSARAETLEVKMQNGHRLEVMTLAAVIATVMFTGTAPAADKKTNIQLSLKITMNGSTYIQVLPRDAKIWRNRPDKPKKINWWTVNFTSYDELFWELRYDESKGGGTANYFGDVDIECAETEIKVQPDKKPDFPNAQWPYSMTVYACANGQKAQKLATVDPRIIWND
jgi:hypothetical protein